MEASNFHNPESGCITSDHRCILILAARVPSRNSRTTLAVELKVSVRLVDLMLADGELTEGTCNYGRGVILKLLMNANENLQAPRAKIQGSTNLVSACRPQSQHTQNREADYLNYHGCKRKRISPKIRQAARAYCEAKSNHC
jgi:hypothetical protein